MDRSTKDSGVDWIGEIPKNWELTKVKRIGQYINGYAFKPDEWSDSGLPIIRIQNLTNHQKDFNRFKGEIDSKYLITEDDYLISWSATLDVFKWTREDGYLNQHIFKAIPNLDVIDYCYFYWLASAFIKEMANDKHGSAMQHVTKPIFDNFKIPLPSLSIQKQINSILDKKVTQIDFILKKTKQSIEEFKKYKQALITESVTKGLNRDMKMKDSRIEWIGEIPEHWEVNKLKRSFKIKKDIANELGYEILSVTQKGLKIKDITSNGGQISADYSKYQIVEPNDFVMNHMDLLTGWVDCSKVKGVTSPDYRVFKAIDPLLVNNQYYNYIFQACYSNKIFYGLGQGVSHLGRWRLPTDNFLNFFIPIAPLNEQKQIVDYLDEKTIHIDSLIQSKVNIIAKLEEYKNSLICEYVTGKKEVR